jgi:hypothetical protein
MLSFILRRRFSIVILMSILLSSFGFAEARTIPSEIFFKGRYKSKIIYGTINSLDNRICTVINNRVVVGKLTSSDSNMANLSGQKVIITDYLLKNPVGYKKIPSVWLENRKFQECSERTSHATCHIKEGAKYFNYSEDKSFSGIINSRKKVFLFGEETASLMHDEEKADEVNWGIFTFSLNKNSVDYITKVDNLNCRS